MYPEKQLAEKMGIAKGKGEITIILTLPSYRQKRGVTDGQIQEALPMQSESDSCGASATGQDGRLGSRSGGINAPEEGTASVNEDQDLRKQ